MSIIWKGEELGPTIGDLMDAIMGCESREEAQEFMRLYRPENEHADANVGYLSGYCGPGDMRRIQDWFGASHPIFGKAVPPPEHALEAGKRAAMGEFS